MASAAGVPPPSDGNSRSSSCRWELASSAPNPSGAATVRHSTATAPAPSRRCPVRRPVGRASRYVRTMTAIQASAATSRPIAPPTRVRDESRVPIRSDRSARSVSTSSVRRPSTKAAMIAAPVRYRRRARWPAPGTSVDSQRREQRGAEGGEAAGVGPTGRVEPQFLRSRPVVADGRVLDGRPLRCRAAALVDDGALRAGNAVRSGLGNGRRGPVVEHRAAAGRPGVSRRAWCAAPGRRNGRAHRRRASGAEPRGGSRRASAGRRGATGHGRGSAGHLTRAGRGGSPRGRRRTARTRGRTGVRGRGGSSPAGGSPPAAARGPATRREARSGAADGGHGDGGATASPVSGCRARPRWSPPGPPRDDTYGFDDAAAAAETPRRPCAAAAAGVAPRRRSTMRPDRAYCA